MTVYTYVDGRKIELEKEPDAFVARASREDLEHLAADAPQQMSSASFHVSVDREALDTHMEALRSKAMVVHHAYRTATSGRPFLLTDRVVVSFDQPPGERKAADFAARHDLELLRPLSEYDYVYRLTEATGMNPIKFVVALTEQPEPGIAAVNHDLNCATSIASDVSVANVAGAALPPAGGDDTPTDPAFLRQWHLHGLVHHPEVDPRAHVRCLEAWKLMRAQLGDSLSHGRSDIVVGISDDGCKLDHPDFNSQGKFAGWAYMNGEALVSSTDPGADPTRMYQPHADHGTACAGVVAAELDGVATVGAAPGCRLLPVRFESDDGRLFISHTKLMTVLDYIADKVDVFSCSWAGEPDSVWPAWLRLKVKRLAESGGRRGKGILFVWAAGNGNCPISLDGATPIPWTNGWAPNDPATRQWVGVRASRSFYNNRIGLPGVLHVAALSSTAQRSHYSNYGEGIDLCAPSSNKHTYKRLTLPGLAISTAGGVNEADPDDVVTDTFGGTSSAAPLVAGVAGLVLSANPGLTAIEVADILKATASRDLNMEGYLRTPPAGFDPDPGWDVSPVSPYDSGAFDDRGWSPWFGHGRVDAEAAVRRALGLA